MIVNSACLISCQYHAQILRYITITITITITKSFIHFISKGDSKNTRRISKCQH